MYELWHERSSYGHNIEHNRQNFEHNRLESIHDLLMNHFMTNDSFADEQQGFSHCQSCTIQLLVALEKWSETDQGLPVDVIILLKGLN